MEEKETREDLRYDIPDKFKAKIFILDEEKNILFDAKIIDISLSGVGLEYEMYEKINKLFFTLKTTNKLVFETVKIKIHYLEISCTLTWIWSNQKGKSGMRISNLSPRDKNGLIELIEKYIKKEQV